MDILSQNWAIIVSSFVVYVFIIVGLRLFGKKELAQLSVPDLVFVLLISNAVQNAMVGSNTSLSGGLVAASTLFIANYILKYFFYKFSSVQKWIQGNPVLLVYKGHIKDQNLRKSQITTNELMEAVREHGVADIKDVDLAMLEADGNISVSSDNFKTQTTQKGFRRKRKHRNYL